LSNKCGIYGIKNSENGKWYIGQSVRMMRRKTAHFVDLRCGRHGNEYLQRAFLKYGEQCFEFHIIEEGIPESVLDVRERAWIEYYKSNDRDHGYNLDSGGQGSGRHHSEETKAKISCANSGRKWTKEQRERFSRVCIGRKPSEDTRRKLSESHKNSQACKDWYKRMGAQLKGRKESPESRAKKAENMRRRWACPESRRVLLESKGIGKKQVA
jgi:group I intron endonuclease